MSTSFTYLGFEVGGSQRKVIFWEGIIEKIRKRLDKWKCNFLSLTRRICLLRFVQSSLPLFYMSFFRMPVTMANTIKRIKRKFLWGWGKEGRKIAWVA